MLTCYVISLMNLKLKKNWIQWKKNILKNGKIVEWDVAIFHRKKKFIKRPGNHCRGIFCRMNEISFKKKNRPFFFFFSLPALHRGGRQSARPLTAAAFNYRGIQQWSDRWFGSIHPILYMLTVYYGNFSCLVCAAGK